MKLVLENRAGAEIARLDVELGTKPEAVVAGGRVFLNRLRQVRVIGVAGKPEALAPIYRETEAVEIDLGADLIREATS